MRQEEQFDADVGRPLRRGGAAERRGAHHLDGQPSRRAVVRQADQQLGAAAAQRRRTLATAATAADAADADGVAGAQQRTGDAAARAAAAGQRRQCLLLDRLS